MLILLRGNKSAIVAEEMKTMLHIKRRLRLYSGALSALVALIVTYFFSIYPTKGWTGVALFFLILVSLVIESTAIVRRLRAKLLN